MVIIYSFAASISEAGIIVQPVDTVANIYYTMSSQTVPITKEEFEQAISELPDDALFTVKNELETSLQKLYETNELLRAELPEANPDDKVIYEEALEENQPVIESKQIRMEVLMQELKIRGLVSSS